MDKWNEKERNTYTDINAQRRLRRRPGMNTPVESEESAVTEVPDGLERWLLDDEPETAGQAEPAVAEVPDLPEEPDVPEEADLPEVTEDAAEEEIPETLMPEEPEPNTEPEAEEAITDIF